MNEDRNLRTQKFKEIKETVEFFCQPSNDNIDTNIEIVYLFAKNFMVSKLSYEALQKCSSLSLRNFYKRDYNIFRKNENQNGFQIMRETDQGTKLH